MVLFFQFFRSILCLSHSMSTLGLLFLFPTNKPFCDIDLEFIFIASFIQKKNQTMDTFKNPESVHHHHIHIVQHLQIDKIEICIWKTNNNNKTTYFSLSKSMTKEIKTWSFWKFHMVMGFLYDLHALPRLLRWKFAFNFMENLGLGHLRWGDKEGEFLLFSETRDFGQHLLPHFIIIKLAFDSSQCLKSLQSTNKFASNK